MRNSCLNKLLIQSKWINNLSQRHWKCQKSNCILFRLQQYIPANNFVVGSERGTARRECLERRTNHFSSRSIERDERLYRDWKGNNLLLLLAHLRSMSRVEVMLQQIFHRRKLSRNKSFPVSFKMLTNSHLSGPFVDQYFIRLFLYTSDNIHSIYIQCIYIQVIVVKMIFFSDWKLATHRPYGLKLLHFVSLHFSDS